MKKAFKLLFVAMLVVLMLCSVVACDKGGTGGGSASATPTPVPGGSTDPEAIFTEPGETYSFYSWQYDSESPYSGADERNEQMRKRISEIEETHGITIEFVPDGSQGAMLQAAFQGVPDITGQKEGGLHTMMDTYLYMGNPGRCLIPLSDHSDVYDFRDDNKFNVFSQYDLCEYNGKLWFFIPDEIGVHFECGGNCLVFNKEIIKNAGYSAEEIYKWVDEGNWTWEKFEEVLQATTDPTQGIYGIERGNAALVMWSLANSNGTEFVTKVTLSNNQFQDSFVYSGDKGDRLMRAYDEFIKFADEGWMETSFFKATAKEPLDHFLGGSVAFFYNGYSSNALKYIAEAKEFDYGIVPWPKGPDNVANENTYHSFYPHLNPYCVFRNDDNVKGAVQILCKLYTPIYDSNSEKAKMLKESEISDFTRDEKSEEYLRYVDDDNVKVHFRVFMYSNAQTEGLTNAKTVQDALFGKGEDNILAGVENAKTYFESIANAINTAIYKNSPYSWK